MNSYLSDKLKVVSFISMLMVVYLHSFNLVVRLKTGSVVLDRGYNFFIQEFISQGIARVAVPLFFTISGFLFFLQLKGTWNEFKEKCRKRIKTLAVPYLFWSVWSFLLCFLFQQLPPPRIFFATQLVQDYTASKFLSTLFVHPIAYQLWFLRDLFLLVLLSPIIYWILQKARWLFLVVLIILWCYNADVVFIAIEALLFFVLGGYLALYHTQLPQQPFSKKKTNLFGLLWFSLISAKLFLVFFNYPETLWFIMLHKLGILLGMLALWGIYDNFLQHKKEGLLKWAAYSFFIYAFHEPVLMILKPAFFTLIGKGEINSLLVYIFAPLFSIILGIFVAAQFKRISPIFYRWITGGR